MNLKHIICLVLIILMGGCASWPDEGQGGWAERYQNYPLTDEQEDRIFQSEETLVISEFEHQVLKLDLLKAQGIQQCMPGQLLRAQIYENRIRRLVSAQMWQDAEHDLLIHHHALTQLSNHFETVSKMTSCAGVKVEAQEKATRSIRDQIKNLLNSDNQFAVDDFQITPKYMAQLAQASDLIKQVKNISLLLIGHTDESGTRNDNFELALKRAETVKHWLGIYGVNPEYITTLTQGNLKPYSSDADSFSKRHSDRRVEAIVIDITADDESTNPKAKSLSNWTKILNGPKEY
ncbi:OmpA family protein [Pseudoalteromonas neustonica]|uniref:OmpA family protein n=1 Tax=Pseudoalteromonas neustonica TaxID=1840331 RepID=UPI000A9488AB|nr:OmpA family protein [Pseudoalteromonas neustonica]